VCLGDEVGTNLYQTGKHHFHIEVSGKEKGHGKKIPCPKKQKTEKTLSIDIPIL
jgi:hypothetical protein